MIKTDPDRRSCGEVKDPYQRGEGPTAPTAFVSLVMSCHQVFRSERRAMDRPVNTPILPSAPQGPPLAAGE